jgi:hypothetical protein
MISEDELRAVKRRHSSQLLAVPGVCGVGIEKDAHGEFVLAVHLDGQEPAPGEVPDVIEGVPVKRIQSGPFRKF